MIFLSVPHSGMFRALLLNINFNSLQLAFCYERVRLQLRWALILKNLAPNPYRITEGDEVLN